MYSSKFTGIGRYVYELVHRLIKLDTAHDYVLFFNEPEYSHFTPPNEHITKVLANAPHYSFREQTTFLYQLMKAKLDLMHFTHFNAPILYTRPSIVTIHDLTLSFFPGNKMRAPIYRGAYKLTLTQATRHARKIIAVSHNTAEDLMKMLDTPPEKITTIYEGINDDFKPNPDAAAVAKTKEKLKITKPYILYTGVWRSHKNLVNLIKAFGTLRTKYQEDVQLVITGKKDPLYNEVVRAAKETPCADDIIFTGMVTEKDLINLYTGATLYTLPSLYEGFGLSTLEAMQCGIPVAVSNTSCLPEICGEGNAIFFDPYDTTDIADKLHAGLINPELRETLIKNGRRRAAEFSWNTMATETLALYNQIAPP